MRADYQGSSFWSDSVNVLRWETRYVNIFPGMELAAYDPVNNPFPTRYDGPSPSYRALIATIGSIPAPPTVTPVVAIDPAVYYPVSDHLGTSQLIVDDQGHVVWQADALPFGSMDISIDLLPNHFRFPGQFWDRETGLHYNWHRFYDPATGRYISADPIGLQGGINLFAYVGNDPVNFVDPEGLRIPGLGKVLGWGTKWAAKKIGGKIGEKLGEAAGFFNPEIGHPDEQKEMDQDTDGDGLNDFIDPDDDNDGIPDQADQDPKAYNVPDDFGCEM